MSTAIRRHSFPLQKARVSLPKPGKNRPARRVRQRVPGEYNPRIASRGLTLDTDLGPLDTVAVDRAFDGRGPISLNAAELDALTNRLAALPVVRRSANEPSHLRAVAAAIEVPRDWLAKRVYARRALLREAGLYPAKTQGAGHG